MEKVAMSLRACSNVSSVACLIYIMKIPRARYVLLAPTCPNIEPSCPPTLASPPKSTVLVLSELLKLPCTTVEPNCHWLSILENSFEVGEEQNPERADKLQ